MTPIGYKDLLNHTASQM